jgi:hypothetical protein
MLVMGKSDDKLEDKTFITTLKKYITYIIADYYGLHIQVSHYLQNTQRIQHVGDNELFNRRADYVKAAKTPCLTD